MCNTLYLCIFDVYGIVYSIVLNYLSPLQLIQELFHKCGMRFAAMREIYDKLEATHGKWAESLIPAMAAIYPSMNVKPGPTPDEITGQLRPCIICI